MKRFARLLVISTALTIAAFAADAVHSFTGFIHSNQCAGPACATQCPIDKDPVYTLQTEDRAWVLSDPAKAAALSALYAGKKVTIRGTTQGNAIRITSIAPAQ